MSTGKILTEGGFVRVHLGHSKPRDKKTRLYHLKELNQETIQKAKAALQQVLEKKKNYQGDLENFEKDIREKSYLLREGKIFRLVDRKERQEESPSPQMQVTNKANTTFNDKVTVGNDVNLRAKVIKKLTVQQSFPRVSEFLGGAGQEKPIPYSQLVEFLSKHLISFYQEQTTAIYKVRAKGTWTISLPIEGVYTNLAIIGEEDRKTKSDLNQTFQDKRIPTYETLFKPKQPIAPQDIFKHEKFKDAHQKRGVVFGVAGVGKTTFCQMLALQGTKLWPQFKVIFVISLRHLNEKEYPVKLEGYTPAELLAKECCFDLAKYQTLLSDPKFLEETLLVLDGYDELPKEAESGSLSKSFKKLKELFPHILITSRPTLVDMDYVTELEILGFDPQSVEKYIEKFYDLLAEKKELTEEEAKSKTQKLQKEIKKQPILASLLQIPINLTLACSLFREDEAFFDSNQTTSVTSFYIETSNWFYKKYQLRPGVSTHSEASIRQQRNPRLTCKKVDHLAKACEEIAWWATQQNTLYIDQSVIENILKPLELSLEDLTHLGLLSMEEGQGQFIHLTFQEYFAATYLAHFYMAGKREKKSNPLQEIKFNSQYSLILPMLAGYLSYQGDPATLQAFFTDLLSEPYDLAIGYELRLLARCFEECKDPKIIPQYKDFIEDTILYLKENPFTKLKVNLLARNPRLLRHEKIIQVFKCDLEDKVKQGNALELLGELVVQGQVLRQEVLTIIMGILGDSEADSEAKCYAAEALGKVAESGQALSNDALKALVFFLKDPMAYSEAKCSAAGALGKVARNGQALPKEAIERLIALLKDPRTGHPSINNSAAEALIEVSESGQALSKDALEMLVALLKDPEIDDAPTDVRGYAAKLLRQVTKSSHALSKDALEMLIALLKDPIGFIAVRAVGKVARSSHALSKDALEALIALLKDPMVNYFDAKHSAAGALGKVARSGQDVPKEGLEALIILLKDSQTDFKAKRIAAKALEEVAKNWQLLPEEVLEALIILLKDPMADFEVKRPAVEVLGEMAKNGQALPEKALEALITLLKEPKDLRAHYFAFNHSAVEALGEVAKSGQDVPKEAPETLIALLQDPFAYYDACYSSVARALGRVVKSSEALSKKVLEALITLLKDPMGYPRASGSVPKALIELAKSSEALSKKVLEALITLLKDPMAHSEAKGSAADALKEMATNGQTLPEEALEALIALLMADYHSEYAVVNALREVAKNGQALPKEAIEALIFTLTDYHLAAVEALGIVAKNGQVLPKEAIERLIALLKEQKADFHDKCSIAKALREVAKNGQALPKEALEALIIFIKDPTKDPMVHFFHKHPAVEALGEVAKNGRALSKEALQTLIDLLKDLMADHDSEYVVATLGEVAESGQALSKDALQALVSFLKDPIIGFYAKRSIAGVLGLLGKSRQPLPQDALEVLMELSIDQNSQSYISDVLEEVAEGCCKLSNKYDYEVLSKLFYLTGHAFFYQSGIFYASDGQNPLITEIKIDINEVYHKLLRGNKLHPLRNISDEKKRALEVILVSSRFATKNKLLEVQAQNAGNKLNKKYILPLSIQMVVRKNSSKNLQACLEPQPQELQTCTNILKRSPSTQPEWEKSSIAALLWQDSGVLISEKTVDKVNHVNIYLRERRFELRGVKADGNCFCSAFLESYKTLSRKIPLLDVSNNKVSYLRTTIASQYESSPLGSKNAKRVEEIKQDKEWITAFDEGDLLAVTLKIHIRVITVNDDESGCGISDMLTFPEASKSKQDWDTIPENERPPEYIFIVDLGGHFVYAQRS